MKDSLAVLLLVISIVSQNVVGGSWLFQPIGSHARCTSPPTVGNMALRELSSLEKFLGLKKPKKYSTQGDKKVTWPDVLVASTGDFKPLFLMIYEACKLL